MLKQRMSGAPGRFHEMEQDCYSTGSWSRWWEGPSYVYHDPRTLWVSPGSSVSDYGSQAQVRIPWPHFGTLNHNML